MRFCHQGTGPQFKNRAVRGFTLAEVVMALGILGLVSVGMLYGYVNSAQLSEWSAHSLAAQSLAFQGVEQARSAKWDPQAWPRVDELGVTNFVVVDILDIPVRQSPTYATNYVSITSVSTTPPLRQLRSDCVWRFPRRGLFTNTVITLRAADQ